MKTRIQKDSDAEIKAVAIVHTAFKSLTNEQKTRDGTEARQGSGVKCWPPPPRASIIRETWGNFETEEGGVEVREEA